MFGQQNLLSSLAGIRIIEEPNCLEKTDTPKRIHRKRNGMSEAYHRRIQKKWVKRYGWELEPAMYAMGHGVLVGHPELIGRLREGV